MECFYNFNNTTSEKQIIVLKPNCEFLTWNLSSTKINSSPFQLFKQHYLKAMKHYNPGNDLYVNNVNNEIIEAWNYDKQVREEYEELSMESNHTNAIIIRRQPRGPINHRACQNCRQLK